jgi:hypothetical protein
VYIGRVNEQARQYVVPGLVQCRLELYKVHKLGVYRIELRNDCLKIGKQFVSPEGRKSGCTAQLEHVKDS